MKVGLIGLGTMGHGMAKNMLQKGADILVFARNPERRKELRAEGFSVAEDALALAICEVLFLCLPNTSEVQSVLLGEGSLGARFQSGCTIVDFSTIDYNATLALSHHFQARGIDFLDAPISGMAARAEAGTLTVMVGGESNAFDEVYPYFEMVANKILHMGEAGCGQLTKLINQVLFDINAAAISEILPMATRMGLDCGKVGEVVNSGTGRSYASEFFIPRILEGNFSEGYPMQAAYKDLISAAELGARHTIPMPVLAAATSTYQMALCQGFGACDKGGMIQVFENLLGVEYRRKE